MKKNILIGMAVFICLSALYIYPSYGYWTRMQYDATGRKTYAIATGRYYFGAKAYDPNASYKEREIVVIDGSYYIVNMEVSPGDPWHNPYNVRMDNPVRYRKVGEEYYMYTYYERGDYVVHNGKTYEYRGWKKHDLNWISTPGKSNRWREVAATPLNTWYRYKIYHTGDVIEYNGKRYRCRIDNCNQVRPPSGLYWTEIK